LLPISFIAAASAAVDQQHCRAFSDEQLRGRFADTVRRPGNHRYFSFQTIHCRPPVLRTARLYLATERGRARIYTG
jgi:hypothetical protein